MADVYKTVKSSGGDYTTLALWEDANDGDITGVGISEVECFSTSDTSRLTINGWTTDATHYIYIHTHATGRHAGVWDGAKYNLTYTAGANSESAILNYENYVRIDGLQIEMVAGAYSSTSDFYNDVTPSAIYLSNCILRGNPHRCILINDGTAYAWNNIAYTVAGDYAYWCNNGTSYVYNCSLRSAYYGIRNSSGTCTAKNCYAKGTNAGYAYYGTIGLTTCASADTTGSVGLQSIAYNTTQFINVTAGSQDFHLAGTGSALYHVGTDTSGDAAPLNFTTDIDGDTYYSTRSIGADDGPVAAATNVLQMLI